MMKKIQDMNYYEVLEVGKSASTQEILTAYDRLRREYDPKSIAFYSLFTPDESAAIYRRIEDAYRTLTDVKKRVHYDAFLREGSAAPYEPVSPDQTPQLLYEQSVADHDQQYGSNELRRQPPEPITQHIEEFTGPVIKSLREQQGLELPDISNTTRISIRHLTYIEEETFEKLPPRPYVRGFIMSYARTIGCDAEQMAADYLKRYDAAMGKRGK